MLQGLGAVAGGFFGAVKTSWQNSPVGAVVPFSQTVRTIGRTSLLFGCVGGAWSVGSSLSESLRDKDDTVNTIVGACCSGLVVGIFGRSAKVAAGAAAAMSLAAIITDFSGAHLDQRSPAQLERLTTFRDPSAAVE